MPLYTIEKTTSGGISQRSKHEQMDESGMPNHWTIPMVVLFTCDTSINPIFGLYASLMKACIFHDLHVVVPLGLSNLFNWFEHRGGPVARYPTFTHLFTIRSLARLLSIACSNSLWAYITWVLFQSFTFYVRPIHIISCIYPYIKISCFMHYQFHAHPCIRQTFLGVKFWPRFYAKAGHLF